MIFPGTVTQSFQELDQVLRIEELYLLQRVAQKINSILDLETLLEEIVGDVANTFGYDRLGVLLTDESSGEPELYIAAGWTGDVCNKGRRFKIGRDGIGGQAAATGKTYYAPDVRDDPHYIHSEDDVRSEIDIPMVVRGELIGIFNVEHTQVNAFSAERIRLLEALAGHVATAIVNARMFQRERLERERMSKELEEARAIQSALFPSDCPPIDGFKISGVCVPCREVGGDWFDYIPLEGGRLGVVLADVSGKGMGAALLMSSARSVLRLHANNGLSPGEALTKVNSILVSDFPSSRFVTLLYAVVDPAARRVSVANAGHLYPLFVNGEGGKLIETNSGLPLGIMECQYATEVIEMPVGARLFFYTDGVTEAANSADEEYGSEMLRVHAGKPDSDVASVLADVSRFAAGTPTTDDITVVMIAAV